MRGQQRRNETTYSIESLESDNPHQGPKETPPEASRAVHTPPTDKKKFRGVNIKCVCFCVPEELRGGENKKSWLAPDFCGGIKPTRRRTKNARKKKPCIVFKTFRQPRDVQDNDQEEQISVMDKGLAGFCVCLLRYATLLLVDIFKGQYTDLEGVVHEVAINVDRSKDHPLSVWNAVQNELEIFEKLKDDPHVNVINCFGGSLGEAEWTMEKLDKIQMEGEKCFSVLEWAPTTLRMLLDDDSGELKGCTYRKMIQMFIDVTEGLYHLHDNRIVHCDLTPENVHFGNGRAKLGGFHSSTIRRRRSIPWKLAGTFGYSAPELLCSEHQGSELNITNSVDVFALGAIMLEVLTKNHPYDVQKAACPDLWVSIDKCCSPYVLGGGRDKPFPTTSAQYMRRQLMEVMNENCIGGLMPWPNKFWALLKQKGGSESVSRSRANACEVVRHLESLVQSPWGNGSLPWPPELCLLIAECASFVVEDGRDSVTRPSASEVSRRLKKMLGSTWIDGCLPWVEKERAKHNSVDELERGSCCIVGHGNVKPGEVHGGVYKDKQGVEHEVSIKLASSFHQDNTHKALINELRAYERLQKPHPNVVRCFGGGLGNSDWMMETVDTIKLSNRSHFLVVELLPNKSLHSLLYEEAEFPRDCAYREMIGIFVDIAKGLDFLHRRMLVHADIKPSNVLIDDQGTAKLADFGVSQPSLKLSGACGEIGTLGYIAPEVIWQLGPGNTPRITDSIDIFSLGITMAECLTHQHPLDLEFQEEPEALWSLIRDCCACNLEDSNPVNRPSAREVVKCLMEMENEQWVDNSLPWTAQTRANPKAVQSLSLHGEAGGKLGLAEQLHEKQSI